MPNRKWRVKLFGNYCITEDYEFWLFVVIIVITLKQA